MARKAPELLHVPTSAIPSDNQVQAHLAKQLCQLMDNQEPITLGMLERETLYRAAMLARSHLREDRLEGAKMLLAIWLKKVGGTKPSTAKAAKAVKNPLDGAIEAPKPDPAKTSPSTWSPPHE